MPKRQATPQLFAVKLRPAVKTKAAAKGDMTRREEDAKRCRLLYLPPEIRNRIYHMAKEIEFDEGLAPPLLVCAKASRKASCDQGGRGFFSLTQTCKQIRAEYRPLWLRDSAIRLKFINVSKFVDTFYPRVEDYVNAPRLLLISWDHDEPEYEDALLDVTNLLRFRAFCPTSSVSFKSRQLIENDLDLDQCDDCGHMIGCSCETADCDHEGAFEEAYEELSEEYSYLTAINEVLVNNQPSWLEVLRDKRNAMTVELVMDMDMDRLTVYIRYKAGTRSPVPAKKAMFSAATGFLKKHGFLDLPSRADMDFVVGQATGKFTRQLGGCQALVPTYNQVEIPGATVYKPKQTAAKAADK